MKPTIQQLQRQLSIAQSMLRTAMSNKDGEATCRMLVLISVLRNELTTLEGKQAVAAKLNARYRKVA